MRYLMLLIGVLQFFLGCDSGPAGPGEKTPAPPLIDSIPFEFLGHGKILFERTGPYPGNYTGTYLINLDEHTSRVINLGYIYTPVLSPMGDRLLYTAVEYGRLSLDVFVYNLIEKSVTQITRSDSSALYPMWGMDGSTIFFRRGQFLMKTSIGNRPGSEEKLHTFFIEKDGLQWLNYPTGGVSHSTTGLLAYSSAHNAVANMAGIYIMNDDGSNWHQLIAVHNLEFFDSPVLSPAGDALYCLKIRRGDSLEYVSAEIGKVTIADGNYTTVIVLPVQGGSKEWAWEAMGDDVSPMNLCLSPDGKKILFNLVTHDFESHLYCVKIDGSRLTQITSLEGATDRFVSWGR